MECELVKEKLVKVLKLLAEDCKRLVVMESNVYALEARGLEIESLLWPSAEHWIFGFERFFHEWVRTGS